MRLECEENILNLIRPKKEEKDKIWEIACELTASVDNSGVAIGEVGLDLSMMVMLYLGIYFLTIILKTFDLADFIINRKTIREMRIKGTLEKTPR